MPGLPENAKSKIFDGGTLNNKFQEYNVRRPLKDLSSEEFVQSDKEISMTGSTPKTNSSELRSLGGRLTL